MKIFAHELEIYLSDAHVTAFCESDILERTTEKLNC